MQEYSLSFTAGNLLFSETLEVTKLYLTTLDWSATLQKVLEENILQYKSPKSTTRIFSELKKRISQLSPEELEYLLVADKETQVGILWIAICLQYRFINEFVSETIPVKITLLEDSLTYSDYTSFYELKAEESSFLFNIAESTQYKAKTVVFQILNQVGILSKNKINLMILPTALGEFIIKKDIKLLKLFPLTNSEIGRWFND